MHEAHDCRAASRQPDGGLACGIAAADATDALPCAELPLERAGRIEDGDPLVAVEALHGWAPVFGAGGEQHGACGDFVPRVELDDVALDARFERLGAVGGGGPRAELARLRDRAARQFGAADPSGKAEIVLDPARCARLSSEDRALDHQRVKALRGAVYGRAEARWSAADDQQVRLLAPCELSPDSQCPRELPVGRVVQFHAAREPNQW